MRIRFYAFLFIIITMVSCSKDDTSVSPFKSSNRLGLSSLGSLQVNDGMLVFKDVDHFHQTLNELEELVHSDDNSSLDAVLLDFADNLKHNSLHKEILTKEDLLSDGEGINEENDPDKHFIMDSYFRAVLNSDLEFQIGSKFYKMLDQYRTVEIDEKDLESLNDFRLNKDAALSFYKPNVTIINGANGTKMHGNQDALSCGANFTWTQPSINSTTVNFKNLSVGHTGSIWRVYQNGIPITTRTEEHPSITFPAFGTYSVRLELSGNGCTQTATKTVTINSCQADFNFQVVNKNRVNFQNTSTGVMPTNITWEFGDGKFEIGTYFPTHEYSIPGTYNVKLTITNNNGCTSTITKTVTVNFDDCCEGWDRDKDKWYDYIPGQRRIKSVAWAKNLGIIGYHRIGAKTKNYKKKSNNNYAKETADFIEAGIEGKVWLNDFSTGRICADELRIYYTSKPEKQEKVSEHVYKIGQPFRIRYKSLISTHIINDGGTTGTQNVDLGCE